MQWKSMLLTGVLAAAMIVPAIAQQINVVINDRPLNFQGASASQVGGRVLVPLRGVFEALGAQVNFDAPTMTIYAVRGETQLQLRLGSAQAYVNGQLRLLDVPAQARFGRTMVPLRFVSEALGAQVQWDDRTRTVSITDTSLVTPGGDIGIPPEFQVTPTPRPTAIPTVAPVIPPVVPPTNATSVSGTVVKVDAAPPAAITLTVGTQRRIYEIDPNALIYRQPTILSSTGGQPTVGNAVPVALTSLMPGQEVRVRLNAQNQVTQIISTPTVRTARVRFAQGNRIVLDDVDDTTLVIGNEVRFVDAQGRAVNTANIQPGQTVALFMSPETGGVYQVSAHNNDIIVAGGTPTPITNPNIPPVVQPNNPNDTRPEILQVTHNAPRPVKAGSTITVTVRGTAGMRGTFDVSPRAQNILLREVIGRPGEYTGTYTTRAGDDVLNGRITARLISAAGEEIQQQSLNPLTIDTLAPRIIGTFPADGAAIEVSQPNITVYADDLGGSGLAPSTMSITNQGETFQIPTTVAPPTSISGVPPRPLSGDVTVRANVADVAGNVTTRTFTFAVRAALGPVTSITHNATRNLQGGDVVTVEMTAEAGGRASFDLVTTDNRMFAQGIPMTEIAQGRYRGNYTFPAGRDATDLRVVGRFVDINNRLTTSEATTPLRTINAAGPEVPIITTPTDNERVATPITIRGRATPNAIIEVGLRAEGVQYFVFEYKEDMPAIQVRADANGNWQTQPIQLPKPRNVSGLSYVITATQRDAADRVSEPATITVRPR